MVDFFRILLKRRPVLLRTGTDHDMILIPLEVQRMDWPLPEPLRFKGRAVELEPMSEGHVSELWAAAENAADSWKYLRYGPFAAGSELRNCVIELSSHATSHFGLPTQSQGTEPRDGSRCATYTQWMAP